MLVTFFAHTVLQRDYSPLFSSFLSNLQTGLGGTWALLPDELSYVNADWLGDPSGLFSCLSFGPQLPGGTRLFFPLTGQEKKRLCCETVTVHLQKCTAVHAKALILPTHPGMFFFLWESNESPFLVHGVQEAERCWYVLVRRLPRVLASEFPCFNIVCVTHWLYIKALALAERNSGRLIN